jgi:hypothetical protein
MRNRIQIGLGVALAVFVATSANALAAAQDYSSLTSGFSAELTAALPIALAAVGLFIGVIMAFRVVRRILSA